MANINLDSRVLTALRSEDIIKMINNIIDAELEKDVSQMNTELIDECVDLLIETEQAENDSFRALVPLVSSDKFLDIINHKKSGWKGLNVFARAAVIAAVIATSTFSVNAAVSAVTDRNVLGEVGDAVVEILENWGIFHRPDTMPEDAPIAPHHPATEQSTEHHPTHPERPTPPDRPTEPEQPTRPSQTTTAQATQEDSTTPAQPTSPTTEKETTTAVTVPETEPATQAPDEKPSQTTTTKRPGEQTVTAVTYPTRPTRPTRPATTGNDEAGTTAAPEPEVIFTGLSVDSTDMKTEYLYNEEIDYSGIKLYAIYSDGSRVQLDIEDTAHTRNVDTTRVGDYDLRITYKTATALITITVRPDEDSRVSEVCSNDDFDYLLTDKGAYITKYKGTATSIVLDEIDGHNIYAIGNGVFRNSSITYFASNTAQKIFANAFAGCADLENSITPMVQYVGDNAYKDCLKLKDAIYAYNLSYLGPHAYERTSITSLTIPQGITEIPEFLCNQCDKLETVALTEDVEIIRRNAFNECHELTTMSGTAGIRRVEEAGLYEAEKLETDSDIEIPESVTSIGNRAFENATLGNVAFNARIATLPAYCFYNASIESISFGEHITKLGQYSFYRVCELRELDFAGTNIREIDYFAFTRAVNLRSVSFADSAVETLGHDAFSHISALNEVDLGNIKTIYYSAFSGCTNAYIEGLPTTLESLGSNAFVGTRLQTAIFTDNLLDSDIASGAFDSCAELHQVSIPSTITDIGDYAFADCTSLTSITLPLGLETIGEGAFMNNTELSQINLEDCAQLYYLGESAFENCELIQFSELRNMVSTIERFCFSHCTSLVDVTLSESISTISNEAFAYCENLERVTILNAYADIASDAFASDEALTLRGYTGSTTQAHAVGQGIVFYSLGDIETPQTPEQPQNPQNPNVTPHTPLVPNSNDASGYWSNGDWYYSYPTRTLTIYGSGAFSGEDLTLVNGVATTFHNIMNLKKPTVVKFDEGITEITQKLTSYQGTFKPVFPSTITKIGDNAFRNNSIELVNFPSTVTNLEIGDYAFYGTKLTYVSLPTGNSITLGDYCFASISTLANAYINKSGVTEIGDYCFKAAAITSLDISNSTTTIGEGAFYGCTKLETVNLGSGVQTIGSLAFSACGLKSVTIPSSVTTIGDSAFYNSTSLATIELPSGITEIGASAFRKTGITEMTLPSSITNVSESLFRDCASLTSVTLPEGIVSIDDNAFRSTALTTVELPRSLESIGKSSFFDCKNLKKIKAHCQDVQLSYNPASPIENSFGYKAGAATGSAFKVTGVYVYINMNETSLYEYCMANGFNVRFFCDDADYNGYITCTDLSNVRDEDTSFIWAYYESNKTFYIKGTGVIMGTEIMNLDGTVFDEDIDVETVYVYDGAFAIGTPLESINPKYVFLPETMTEVFHKTFRNCTRIESLEFPDSVTHIDDRPFIGCTSLTSVKFGNGLTSVPRQCFKDSTSIKYVDLASVTSIEEQAFMRCPGLESIEIPDTVTSIAEQAFFECLNVVSIRLGTGVTRILDRAFANIPFCDKIIFSNNVNTIFARAFENVGISTSGVDVEYADTVRIANLHSLENIDVASITIGAGFEGFKEIVVIQNLRTIHISPDCENFYVYKNCLYSSDNELVFVPHSMTTVEIKPGTTAIGENAFRLSNINVVRIPDGVTSIGNNAFKDAAELKSVRFPETLDVIGESAFENCSKIKTAFIPYPCRAIAKTAFKNCTQLASVILPEGLISIGLNCFNGCTSLVSIVLPESLELVDSGAFGYIPSLTDAYIWNADVGYNCFINSRNVRIHTLVGTSANAYARANNLAYTLYTDPELFFDDCAAAIDVLAGYLGYCSEGHGDIEWLTVYDGDCENDGYMIGVCEYCSQVLDERHINAEGHKYSQVGYIEETATTAGIRVLKCTTCGEQYTVYTTPTGENPLNEIHSVEGYVTAETGKANAYGNTCLKSVNIVIDGMVVARTNKQGYFKFDIKSGTYMAELQYPYGYTRSIIIVVEDEDIVIDEAIKIVAVDFNRDKRIDDADVALFRVIVSSQEGDTSYLDYVDINHDGYINAKDYMIIQQFRGTTELTYEYPALTITK